MHALPYLFFNGHAKEAIAFYKTAIGITDEVVMTYKDSPVPPQPGCTPPSLDLVMHAQFKVGDTAVFLSDGLGGGKTNFDGFSVVINADAVADAERIFKALTAGGAVTAPLTETFFAKTFGMVKDKFGMNWMLIVPKPM